MKLFSKLFLCSILFVSVSIFSTAFAKGKSNSAESIVTCGFGALTGVIAAENGGIYSVLGRSTPLSIDTGQCRFGANVDLCSTCITSLETQGCKVIETVTDQFADVETFRTGAMTTYMLSCIRP